MYYEVFQLHAELLKALSHPKRLEILHLLREKELSVTEIQEMLDLPQGNLSQHLMVMRDSGIVDTRRKGKQVFYSLAHKNFIKASDLFRQVLIERYKGEPEENELAIKMSELVPLTQDPVCGMRLSPKTASFAKKWKNKDYYFCASGCLDKFYKNPSRFM